MFFNKIEIIFHNNSNAYLIRLYQNMFKPIYKFQHLDKVNWDYLSRNPNAIHILEKNLDKVYWDILSGNPNAIPILEKNLDKVNWEYLSINPNAQLLLSKLDYQAMKLNAKEFSRELAEYVFHPERVIRICERNDLELLDLLEIL